jgi:hypothetical protein
MYRPERRFSERTKKAPLVAALNNKNHQRRKTNTDSSQENQHVLII